MIGVGFCTTAFVTWFLPMSRQEDTPKDTARKGMQNWWKLPAKMKTTSFWLSQERKRHPSNMFGLASSINHASNVSFGLMARLRSTRTGLHLNPLEMPASHAARCIQDVHLFAITLHQDIGMTCLVQSTPSTSTVWSVRSLQINDQYKPQHLPVESRLE